MSFARDEILGRVRRALADVPRAERPDHVAVPRGYRRVAEEPEATVLDRFAERLADYHAEVRRTTVAGLAAALTDACQRLGLHRAVVPHGLPETWRPEGVELVEDDGLTPPQLDALDGTITGCATAIAETGTIVLDGRGACGRRAITLVPDHHLCIVASGQVRSSVSEAIAELAGAVEVEGAPITFISGPSASSDIELSRVEGVHGPRHLLVLIVRERL